MLRHTIAALLLGFSHQASSDTKEVEDERLAMLLYSEAKLAATGDESEAESCVLDIARSLPEAVGILTNDATGSLIHHVRIPRATTVYHSIVVRVTGGHLLSLGVTERNGRCAGYLVSIVAQED